MKLLATIIDMFLETHQSMYQAVVLTTSQANKIYTAISHAWTSCVTILGLWTRGLRIAEKARTKSWGKVRRTCESYLGTSALEHNIGLLIRSRVRFPWPLPRTHRLPSRDLRYVVSGLTEDLDQRSKGWHVKTGTRILSFDSSTPCFYHRPFSPNSEIQSGTHIYHTPCQAHTLRPTCNRTTRPTTFGSSSTTMSTTWPSSR